MKIEKISMALHFLPFSSAMTDFLVTCTTFGEKKKMKKKHYDSVYVNLVMPVTCHCGTNSLYDTLKAKLLQKYIYKGQQKFKKNI